MLLEWTILFGGGTAMRGIYRDIPLTLFPPSSRAEVSKRVRQCYANFLEMVASSLVAGERVYDIFLIRYILIRCMQLVSMAGDPELTTISDTLWDVHAIACAADSTE